MNEPRGGAARKGRLVMGLMSGTSHDGIDAALVRITGRPRSYSLIHHTHLPHPTSLRRRIAAAFTGTVKDICELNVALGERFAQAALRCAQEAGVDIATLDAIGSHGQTVYHVPPHGRTPGSTLQIGEPAVIARRTGVSVVSGFRNADMAEGGQGAPLVPLADWLLFADRAPLALHNLGGISNLTVVTKRRDEVFAFDTGPGCALMDEAAKVLFHTAYDRGGAIARRGTPDRRLLSRLMQDPFFRQRPPRSTGRERYGRAYVEKLIRTAGLEPRDLMATLTHLTARSVALAYERFVLPEVRIKEMVLAGGGAKNRHLVALITESLDPIPVRMIEEFGIPAQAREAMSFAVLANETLEGRPGNLPRVTGARETVVLGSITRP